MEKASRQVVVAAVSSVARSSLVPDCSSIADLVIAAADPFSLAGPDLAAAVGSVGFAVGSAVVVAAVAAGLAVAVDSAATVFAAAADSAVAADLACSVVGSACFFAAAMGKGRAVVGTSCSLTPRSSF